MNKGKEKYNMKRKFTLLSFGVAGICLLLEGVLFYLGLRFPVGCPNLRWLAWTLQILFAVGMIAGFVSLLIKKM